MGFGSFTRLGTTAWESRGPSPRNSPPQGYHSPAPKVSEDELYGIAAGMDGMSMRHNNIQNRHQELADMLRSFSRQQTAPEQSRFVRPSEDGLNERYMRGEETPWTTGRPQVATQPVNQGHPAGKPGPEDAQRQAAQAMMQQFSQQQMQKAQAGQAAAQAQHDGLPQEQLKKMQAENAQLRQRCAELETQNGHLLEYYEVTIHIVRAVQMGQMNANQAAPPQHARGQPQQHPQNPAEQKPIHLQTPLHPQAKQPAVPEQARPQQQEDPRLQQLREQHFNQNRPVPGRHEVPGLTHSPDDEFHSDEEDDPSLPGGARGPWW